MKTLELKARLLSEGANPENDTTVTALQQQNPSNILRGGLSAGLKVQLCPHRR